jgi:hypothetical protein
MVMEAIRSCQEEIAGTLERQVAILQNMHENSFDLNRRQAEAMERLAAEHERIADADETIRSDTLLACCYLKEMADELREIKALIMAQPVFEAVQKMPSPARPVRPPNMAS